MSVSEDPGPDPAEAGSAWHPRRALLVSHAKHRRADTGFIAAAATLQAAGLELVQQSCHGPAELSAIIRRHAGSVDLLVLAGGDGTMNAAAAALIETGLPLGILPLGTANDLARTLGIPPDAEAAAQVILEGHRRRIDLGEVNGHPFFNVASIGLSVAVTKELTGELKRRWGRLAYAIAALRVLPRARPFRAEIICDGQRHHVRTLQVAFGNGRYYGGGMAVEEDAEPNDGVLHLYSLEFDSAWWLAPLLPALRTGRQGRWRQVRTAACREVEIRTRRPRSVNADGELIARTPARLRVLHRAVAVLVPRPSGEVGG
jgi:YegS/Rv2252/BmrU family lipid kinase